MRLFGFTIEIYYDARPYERQIWDIDESGWFYCRILPRSYVWKQITRIVAKASLHTGL